MIGRSLCCRSLHTGGSAWKQFGFPKTQATSIYNKTKSASNYKGYLKHKDAPGMYYQPSESIATGSVNSETIPRSFMAASDPRRGFDMPVQGTKAKQCPNVLVGKSTVNGKTYHLGPHEIDEIKRLRHENPQKYTRKFLAAKYGISPLFVSIISKPSEQHVQDMGSRLQEIQSRWKDKRHVAREDRKRRKLLWYQA
ncbi:mitochondrial 54S ribosomal protein mL58 [Saccharomyces paradoxus]|uniref:Mitochondrial 54S ribosomal protein mL58 n=1 Tax=Saccharomyces paradoxus TaxID=27291 RepID=A0A8B8UVG0_SACPA|nr:Mrpl20 [Saccharomyces paradoxus]QHS74671.1 Mrpl20 [Saccharomyces paradoxus]